MSPDTLAARSYAHARDDYFTAMAVADVALEELADYGSQVVLWGEDEHRYLAELQRREEVAEKGRQSARDRLLYCFCEYLKTAFKPSPDHDHR